MSQSLKIASWNINSVRARAGIVEKFLTEEAPDILCLQETKVRDSEFPEELFRRLGYDHLFICGQPMHHGVAIASRLPLREDDRLDWQANGEARHLGVRLDCGVRLENVYVPAGGDVPDRAINPKFGQKLDFIERMTRWSETLDCPTIMVGDFNVAPLECDVWSHKQLLNVVSHTPVEVEALTKLQGSGEWTDLGRHFFAAPQRLHTWWSSLGRLDGQRSRPPPRSYVGDPGRRETGGQPSGLRTLPELDAAVGPCSADDGIRALSGARDVARAIDALRRGWPVALGEISFLAIDTADRRAAAFDGDARRRVRISAPGDTLTLTKPARRCRPSRC